MSRYLTPSKIALLLLSDLYLSRTAGPAASKLLRFISRHTVAQASGGADLPSYVPSLFPIELLLQESSQWPSNMPGKSASDLLLRKLWELEGLDSVQRLFERLADVITSSSHVRTSGSQAVVSPASPLGVFIRRSSVEFNRMQFADAVKLWKAFKAYRQPTFQLWAQKDPEAARSRNFNTLSVPELDVAGVDFQMSFDDASSLVSVSISKVQRLGCRLPDDVKSKIHEWIHVQRDSSSQSSRYFLAFFDHWKAGQYSLALSSLHQYFDYSLATKSSNDNLRAYYQYALLHLSVLHADFEFWSESINAMEQCIETARENQDHACLNFALSWQLYLQQSYSRVSAHEKQGMFATMKKNASNLDKIALLKSMARDGRQWSLLCSALLEEAKFFMTGSDQAKSFESILQASHLGIQHDLRTLLPAILVFQAANYQRLGQSHLTLRVYELSDIVFADQVPVSDRVRACCRLAIEMAQLGRIRDAMAMLDKGTGNSSTDWMDKLGGDVQKMEQRVLAFKTIVQTKHMLSSGKIDHALRSLVDLRPLISTGDPELSSELYWLEIESLLVQRHFVEAMDKVRAQLTGLGQDQQTDIARMLRLMILKSRIFAAAGQAPKGLATLVRAGALAQQYHLFGIFMEACEVLCHFLNCLGEYEAARDLGAATLPLAIENTHVRVSARLYTIVGESHVGLAGRKCAPASTERASNINQALVFFERSLEAYLAMKDLAGSLEVLTMKARLLRFVGDEASAFSAEDRYRQLEAQQFD